jgi:hypothetical protein
MGADMLSIGIEINAPDDIGDHQDCLLVPGFVVFLGVRALGDVIAHDYH